MVAFMRRMVGFLLWVFISFLGIPLTIALLIASILVYGFWVIEPHDAELDPERERAAVALAEKTVEAITADMDLTHRHVRVARLGGDPGDILRERLKLALPPVAQCQIVPDSLMRKGWDEAVARFARVGVFPARRANQWRMQPVRNREEAVAEAQRTGADYLVYGHVRDFRVEGSHVNASMRLALASPSRPEEPVWSQTVAHSPNRAFPALGGLGADAGSAHPGRPILRTVAWLCGVMLLPLVTAPVWRAILDLEFNGANFLVLSALTALAALFAWALLGISAATAAGGLILAVATLASCIWNFLVLNFLEERRIQIR